MLITYFVLIVIVLLIVFGGLVFHMSLHKRGGLHRGRQNYRKSHTAQLHEIIFLN